MKVPSINFDKSFVLSADDHTEPDDEQRVRDRGARRHAKRYRQSIDYTRGRLRAAEGPRHPRLQQSAAVIVAQHHMVQQRCDCRCDLRLSGGDADDHVLRPVEVRLKRLSTFLSPPTSLPLLSHDIVSSTSRFLSTLLPSFLCSAL